MFDNVQDFVQTWTRFCCEVFLVFGENDDDDDDLV